MKFHEMYRLPLTTRTGHAQCGRIVIDPSLLTDEQIARTMLIWEATAADDGLNGGCPFCAMDALAHHEDCAGRAGYFKFCLANPRMAAKLKAFWATR